MESVDSRFFAIQGVKLYEQVVEKIQMMISQGVYQKGDILPSEKEFIEMMNVSRITIREALRILAEAGVIETRQGKGSIVLVDSNSLQHGDVPAVLDYRANFTHTTNARLALEPAIARQVAEHATDEQIAAIERTLRITPTRKKGYKLNVTEDFHRALVESTENPYLLEFFDHLVAVETHPPVLLTLIPPNKQKNIRERLELQHCNIFEAIKNHDCEFAYFYMKEHTLYIKQVYEEYFQLFYTNPQ